MGQPRREPMRPHPQPAPDPPLVDRARVRALVTELHAAKVRGESIHAAPPIYAIDDLVGSCMAGSFVEFTLSRPDAPPSVDSMVDHIMKYAARWAQDAAWMRSHP
jgi:hypothetical protein